MYSFLNDYSEGAHERVLEALCKTNRLQTCGYGLDEYCERARELIKKKIRSSGSAVHFLVGGTQTNLTMISAILRPHQGVVSAVSGHINMHETGAIEASGHKILAVESADGKLSAGDVEALIAAHYSETSPEHMVQPGMVYVSNPTEVGTIYSKKELSEIHRVCKKHNIPLFLDGARLGCALAADSGDIKLADLAKLTDAFYIGGTKMGALFGEALVINDPKLDRDFRYIIKQKGGLLAKGRLLGIQFYTLLEDDLYTELARHANRMAKKLSDGIVSCGYRLLFPTMTNQVFAVFPKKLIELMERNYAMTPWEGVDDTCDAVRLCTSWATEEMSIDEFLEALKATR